MFEMLLIFFCIFISYQRSTLLNQKEMAEDAFNEDSNSPVVTEVAWKITEDLNQSFEFGTYEDVTIITRGGLLFILSNTFLYTLSARSTYFERMFAYPDCSGNK